LVTVTDPTSFPNLRTIDGQPVSFVEAARARGLLEDNALWLRTVEEAFNDKTTIRRRIRWLAMFLSTANLTNPTEILDAVLGMKHDWLINTEVAKKSLDERRQYVLRNIEWFLRANGIRPDEFPRDDDTFESCCEHIGLPRPEGLEIDATLIEEVIILFLLLNFIKLYYFIKLA
jgi:hypothetical protein